MVLGVMLLNLGDGDVEQGVNGGNRSVDEQANIELQGFLKEHTQGTAASIVRNNRSGLGLESWRRLCFQFNPKTTMTIGKCITKFIYLCHHLI